MAQLFVRDAALLLTTSSDLLLACVIESSHTKNQLRTATWDRRFNRCDEARNEGFALSIARQSLELAGQEILADLRTRWPRTAVPAEIGILTDGTGLVFSPNHPSPLASGWIARHASGFEPVIYIVPVNARGAWANLSRPVDSSERH